MPGIGLEIDGAIQHAAHAGRQLGECWDVVVAQSMSKGWQYPTVEEQPQLERRR